MKNSIMYLLTISLAVNIFGCKKPYDPPAIAAPGSYLVVEGEIDSGSDSTAITLSKTVNLSSVTTANPVLNATVTVESNQNTSFPLIAAGNGKYVSAGLNLSSANQYRLRIVTPNDTYLSDFVAPLNSPPIDSITYSFAVNGINIYASTHDPNNIIKYYRWNYGETWLFNAFYDSEFISNGDTVLARSNSQQVYSCWQHDTSSTIILGSAAKLSQAVITNNPIGFVPSTSPKIQREYSILVRQYALSGDAYNFWTNLKTSTEDLGSIFDAQPSQINGNIHSVTNSSEPVIGYISVGSSTNARIFIGAKQTPNWPPPPAVTYCTTVSALYAYLDPLSGQYVNQVNEFINYEKGATTVLIPINAIIFVPGGPIEGYTAAIPACVDCTLSGTNIEPPFWKQL